MTDFPIGHVAKLFVKVKMVASHVSMLISISIWFNTVELEENYI